LQGLSTAGLREKDVKWAPMRVSFDRTLINDERLQAKAYRLGIYSKTENLVLRARSEMIGSALDQLGFQVSGFRFQFYKQNPAILSS
jgi:hypothetical protein